MLDQRHHYSGYRLQVVFCLFNLFQGVLMRLWLGFGFCSSCAFKSKFNQADSPTGQSSCRISEVEDPVKAVMVDMDQEIFALQDKGLGKR